ncbi:MAG: hypothetical protein ACXWAC_12420 [Usitatibacter sp.]
MTPASRTRLALAGLLLFAATAQAQIRAFVSTDGNDNNPCTNANPCRHLQRGIDVVATGGQVWIVDSGNFNAATVTVTKSVSIEAAPGQVASIVAANGNAAMVINAPGGTVGLRNLLITDGLTGTRQDGIIVNAATAVSVENCLFADVSEDALVALHNNAFIHVANTTFRNVNGWAVAAQSGPTIDVANSHLLHTEGAFAFGTNAGTTSTVSITDSTISDGTEGVFASTNVAGATAQIFVTRSTIFGTTYALDSESTSGTTLITVANSSVNHNQQAFFISGAGATVKSLGNNYIADNVTETGVLTTAALR